MRSTRTLSAVPNRREDTRYPLWHSCLALFLLLLGIATGFGCRSVSYKLGSTDRDEQIARDRCRNESRAETQDFERCMEKQGWIVKQLEAPAAPSNKKRSVPAESVATGSPSSPTAGDIDPVAKAGGAPAAEPPIVVESWFKLGATANELDAATERCVAKLGAAHRPEPKSHVVTGEMIDCLGDEGWHALPSH